MAGLAPFNMDSGKRRGKRSVWGGRSEVRNVLYMAALTAIKFNSHIKIFYEHLIKEGKPFKVAITACMHKLLCIINSMVKHNTFWRENFSIAS